MVSPSTPSVEDLVDTLASEDVVAAFYPVREAKLPEKCSDVVKSNAGIR
jgi:hypothetical protein